MANFLLWVFVLLISLYVYKILFFYCGLFRLKTGKNLTTYSVSVLVPARDEENNITTCLDSLLHQDYPKEHLEIIVIDDGSKDRTTQIVKNYCEKYPFMRLISLTDCPSGMSPKKRALTSAIQSAAGEIIFTTDADCWMSSGWISRMVAQFDPEVGVVVGYVGFAPESEKTLFHKIQSLEFIGLTTAGIGSIGAGDPIIANGANFAFRKTTFNEVNGYKGQDHIMSGDDDLLLQKIDQNTNWKIRATAASETFVFTRPMPDIQTFIRQRIRWASKSLVYKKITLVLFLISTYLLYLLLFVSIPLSLWLLRIYPYPVMVLLIKIAIDYLLICKGTALVQRRELRKYFLFTELIHLPYILVVGLAGILSKVEWKGR